jgi:mannose-6-phosphate isomerase-like protein (cupin superfamily)
MKAHINQFNPDKEFYTQENCYITELSNSADDPDVSIARARVKPGITTHWHRLRETIERYCIVSGSGCVEVGDLPPREVNAGDAILIPPLCRQRITNIGSEDLVFLAICSPRFKNEIYEDLETDQNEF